MWEISQKTILKMAADRGPFIDQSQSLNVHIAEPNYGKLTSMHFYAWKLVGGAAVNCNHIGTGGGRGVLDECMERSMNARVDRFGAEIKEVAVGFLLL